MNEMIHLKDLPIETLAIYANEAAELCEATGRLTVEHAIRAGRALLAAKDKLKHGEWSGWLEYNFRQSHARACQYMEIANFNRDLNLEDATSIRQALRLIADSPEKQAKKQEREAKKLETPPKSLAPATPAPPVTPATIRNESPPVPQPQPERLAWLADPDELDRHEEDDLPPLPKTNTHYTTENHRQPDARETDRIGIVPPDDPRTYHDGNWYEWNEDLGRMVAVADDQILWRAKAIGEARGLILVVSGAPTPEPRATKKVVDRDRETKRFVRPTVAEVAAYAAEIGAAIDPEQFCDFYESKAWMIGKNKMKDWKAAVRTWKRQQAGKAGSVENGKVRSANWEDDGTGWEDLRDG